MTTSDVGRVLDAGATAGAVVSADRFGGLTGENAQLVTPNAEKPNIVRRLNFRGGRAAQGGNMRWLVGMLGLALLAVPLLAQAQTEAVYALGRFSFENGGEIADMKVGYVAWGKLNDAKDNAILLLPGTSAGRHFAAAHIGPGKTYDTDKYFVIGVDPIGGGNSSSPKDGLGTAFPKYTIRDMVRAQHVDGDQGPRPDPSAGSGRVVDGLLPERGVGDQLSRFHDWVDSDRASGAQRPPFRCRRGRVRGDDHARSEIPGWEIHRESHRRDAPRRADLFPVDHERRISRDLGRACL